MRLTARRGRDYGSRLPVRALLLRSSLLSLALLAACQVSKPPAEIPLDRYAFPTGVALSGDRLLVVSSNFDLLYDNGSLTSVDLRNPTEKPAGIRIGSFGGQVAIAGAECGAAFATPQALVPSRVDSSLWVVPVGGDGPLTCQDCRRDVAASGAADPYSVGLSCGPGTTPRAWLGYLRSSFGTGFLGTVNLETGERLTMTTGVGTPRSFAFDSDRNRIYWSSTNSGTTAPIRYLELAGGCTPGVAETAGGCPLRGFDLYSLFNGSEGAGIALSHPLAGQPRRMYIAVRLYDATLATSIGTRPSFDTGGLLLVLELQEGPFGEPSPVMVRAIDIGLGAAEVQVLPARPGKRDLVAVTATEDGRLWIYDDDLGAMVKVFGHDPVTGAPVLGHLPFGLAMKDETDLGRATLYVAAFEDGFVTPVHVPLANPAAAELAHVGDDPSQPILRIGGTQP